MSVHVSRRPATQDEIDLLDRQWLSPGWYALFESLGAFLLYFVLAFFLLMTVGAIGGAIVDKMALDPAASSPADWPPWAEGLLVAVLWGPVFVLPSVVAIWRYRRARKRRLLGWRDLHERCIEQIEFNDEAYTIIEAEKMGSVFAFDMPAGGALCMTTLPNYLYLLGIQVIEDLEEEMGDYSQTDADLALSRHLPEFPACSFQVQRWPHTGLIIHIRSTGGKQEAAAAVALRELPRDVAKRLAAVWQKESDLVLVQRSELG